MIFATPTFAIQAYVAANKLGWKPHVVINQVSSASSTMQIAAANAAPQTQGSISTVVFKDPQDPTQRNDPGVQLYRQILAKYQPSANVKDVYNVYGMAVAYTMVDALKKAGKNLSRKSLMTAVTHLKETSNPFLLKGVVLSTTPADRFPVKQAQLEQWRTSRWVRIGKLLSARG
jgi:branched-chain amino acid transport system substrate-binding protein